MSRDLSRRAALELFGGALGLGLLPASDQRDPAGTPFERGAMIRTLLQDISPDAISGSTLFHEHLSIRYPLTRALARSAKSASRAECLPTTSAKCSRPSP